VFVMLPRVPDWYDVVLGCIKLGAIPMPATTLLTPRDIAYRVNSAEASVVVVDAEATTKLDQAAADCPSLREPGLPGRRGRRRHPRRGVAEGQRLALVG
jgi:acyl-coenzyme A synthetase/AMP-(fatty) acid ligase